MPDEYMINKKNEETRGKYKETRVNKKGQMYHPVEYDPPLEPPMQQSLTKPKSQRKKPKVSKEGQTPVEAP